jgi:hypothetical protein
LSRVSVAVIKLLPKKGAGGICRRLACFSPIAAQAVRAAPRQALEAPLSA